MTDSQRTEAGVWCRSCGTLELWVIETSHAPVGIVRRRQCRGCGVELWTIETLLTAKPAKRVVRAVYPPMAPRRS